MTVRLRRSMGFRIASINLCWRVEGEGRKVEVKKKKKRNWRVGGGALEGSVRNSVKKEGKVFSQKQYEVILPSPGSAREPVTISGRVRGKQNFKPQRRVLSWGGDTICKEGKRS